MVPRALAACREVTTACGLPVDDVALLHDSNRLAVRLDPCSVLARVAPLARRQGADLEIDVARRLQEAGAPLAGLDPRVEPRAYEHDGFVVTLWTFHPPVPTSVIQADEYADALGRMHAAMRRADVDGGWVPRFLDRVDEAVRVMDDPANGPSIVSGGDRALVVETLRTMRRVILDRGEPEQLLHGEPHPGNVLRTDEGLLFVDLETCCRGPVEFDIAHPAVNGTGPPLEVARHYAGADLSLVRHCWILMLAMIVAWRCEPGDDLPNGRALTEQWLGQLRALSR